MFIKTLSISAIAAAALALGGSSAANAHGSHFHGFYHHPGLFLRVGPPPRDCSFYREMWEDIGFYKWKRRYYECRGWW